MTTDPTPDRAALRDRIAEALYAHEHPGHLVPLNQTGMGPAYREAANAVLAVLPKPADRPAVLREAADRLADEIMRGARFSHEDARQPGLAESVEILRRMANGQPAATKPPGVEARHTCHDQKSAPGHDWECQWCSTLPDDIGPAAEARPSSGPPCGNNPNHRLTPGDRQAVDDFKAYLAQRATDLLALATVLEIPRPEPALPIQLRRSHGHTNRWAISDGVAGRRWHRERGWVYEQQGIRDEDQRDATRYTLAEAVPLARKLAAGVQP